VIHLNFNSVRLFRDFSLDAYWIEIPADVNQKKLRKLLGYLPSANIFYTDQNTQIWTRLTPVLFKWIKNKLNWNINPVFLYFRGKYSQEEWYDSSTGKWKIPHILRE